MGARGSGADKNTLPNQRARDAATPSRTASSLVYAAEHSEEQRARRVADTPNIAVIIVTWNSEAVLERCLCALEQQTVRPQHIIVVDNGSLAPPLDLEERYPGTQVIRLETNRGFAAAMNIGVRAAQESEWVAILNPDAFPQPTWLAALWQAVQEHPEYTFFGSYLLRATHPDEVDGLGDAYHCSGLAWRQYHGQQRTVVQARKEEIFAPSAAAALYRRDVFLNSGGFDEQYFCYGEDVDLGFRLRLAGQRCLLVPEAVAHHIGGGSCIGRSKGAVYYGHRNLMWTYVKDMPGKWLWLFLPQYVLLNLASVVWLTWQGQGRAIWQAKWDGLLGLRAMWHKRQAIQRQRQVNGQAITRLMATGWWTPYRRRRDLLGLSQQPAAPPSLDSADVIEPVERREA